MEVQFTLTNRGFELFEFQDLYGEQCSLQKSSLATQDCIWFGVHENRMHLTQEMVQDLLPALCKFAVSGELT